MTDPLPCHRPARIVVTGVGAIIGQGIVKALRKCGRNVCVIGIDRNPQSVGPQICDIFYAKPACDESSEKYLAFWRDFLGKDSVDLVLPGLEVDCDLSLSRKHSFRHLTHR